MSWIIQIRNLSALKDLDHEVGIDHTNHTDHTDHTDHLAVVCLVCLVGYVPSIPGVFARFTPDPSPWQGSVRPQYPTERFGMVRYELDTRTLQFGKFGTPTKRTPGMIPVYSTKHTLAQAFFWFFVIISALSHAFPAGLFSM